MRLLPRHYLLIAVLVSLSLWNIWRLRRAHLAASQPVVSGPGWQAFDHAAALKDAPDSQFTPALDALRQQTEGGTGPEAADLRSCQMWLLYYRHSAPMAGGKPGDWAMLATGHVQSCLSTHRDTGR